MSLRSAKDPATRDAVRAILKDEVDHARLGWAHLMAERERDQGEFLSAMMPAMLHDAVRGDELLSAARSSGDQRADTDESAALGYVPMATRLQLFAATVRDLVLPGLARAGLDPGPGAAWLSAYGLDGGG